MRSMLKNKVHLITFYEGNLAYKNVENLINVVHPKGVFW